MQADNIAVHVSGGRRHHNRRRGGIHGRGRGGRGAQEDGRGMPTPVPQAGNAGDALGKQAEVVVTKINKENKAPQDADVPIMKNVSFAKNDADASVLKNVPEVETCSETCGTAREKEKMQQKLKEAREQAAAAKEKKKSKKSKKHEKWLLDQQQQQEARAKIWAEKVRNERIKCQLISDVIGTEFNRVNKGVEISKEIQQVITEKSSEANDALYGSNIKCRVEVVGLEKKDFNGRKGSIRHWDEDKGQFCVALDTKKSRDYEVHFFKPENLDEVTSPQSVKKERKDVETNYTVSITTQGVDNIGCQFSLEKSDLLKLESARIRSIALQEFREERDALASRLMKEQEERREEEERELREEEEKDRKRRAELKAKKRAEKELKKEEMRQKREKAFKIRQEKALMEFERKRTEQMKMEKKMKQELFKTAIGRLENIYEMQFNAHAESGMSLDDFEEFKEGFKEKVTEKYAEFFDENELQYICEEIFAAKDKEFKEILLEDRLKEDKMNAEILGVSHDVDKRTLQKTYRKLALQFHPDKWSADSSHGMSKDEAEEHFKSIRSSYDHLMANFDDDDDDE